MIKSAGLLDKYILENTTPYAGYIRTTDGGNSWLCDTIPGVTNSFLQGLFAIDADTAYITCFKLLGSAGNSRGIYKTTDGGKNWIRQRGNQIGSETDSLVAYGIEVGNSDGTLIENNLIQNMKATLSGSNQAQIGIALDGGNNQIIRNNVIRNCSSISGYITSGIYVGVGGTNNQVNNNMVSGIHSTSKQADSRLAGIYLAYQTNPKVYYNSVYLYGTGANHLGSAALYIYTSCTNVKVMNNILVNTRDESPYCCISNL